MSNQNFYKDIAKHSIVYGAAQILGRLASFLLLPIYTTYLRPADYGVIAILDLFAGFMGIMIASAMISAVTRFHFEAKSAEGQRQVWWTGMTFSVIIASILVGLGALFLQGLTSVTLGPTVPDGDLYLSLMLGTIWAGSLGHLPITYFRVQKWSRLFVGFSLCRLFLNIVLNLYFLAVLDLGIQGVLLGNLITECVNSFFGFTYFSRCLGAYLSDWVLGRKLWKFASPLIVTGFLLAIMHQSNRYFLRLFVGLDQVGLFSLAYTLGQGVNSLILIPFSMIWGVIMYEIAGQPNAKHIFVSVFEYFTYGVALVLFGLALFSKPLLTLMVAPDYLPAASLVPIICLAFFFFSLHGQFNIPVLLAKRTTALIPVTVLAVLVNVGANLVLIPPFGLAGAAWASVITFVGYSFGGLYVYRKIDYYEYPLTRCSLVSLGLIISYMLFLAVEHSQVERIWAYAFGALIWLAWASGLFGLPLVRFLSRTGLRLNVEGLKKVGFQMFGK